MAYSKKPTTPTKRAIKKESSVKLMKKLEKAGKKVAKGKVPTTPKKRTIKKTSNAKMMKTLEKAGKKVAKGKVKRGNKIMNKVIKKY